MIIAVKINKSKIFLGLAMLALILLVAGIGYKLMTSKLTKNVNEITDNNLNQKVADYIKSYGWNVERNFVETEEFTIPNDFNIIYKRYNQYQLDIGKDLTPFKGKPVKRFTYKISNYKLPNEFAGQQVYADILTYDNQIIGGDLKTNELNGFMVSLKNHTFKDITGREEWEFN